MKYDFACGNGGFSRTGELYEVCRERPLRAGSLKNNVLRLQKVKLQIQRKRLSYRALLTCCGTGNILASLRRLWLYRVQSGGRLRILRGGWYGNRSSVCPLPIFMNEWPKILQNFILAGDVLTASGPKLIFVQMQQLDKSPTSLSSLRQAGQQMSIFRVSILQHSFADSGVFQKVILS